MMEALLALVPARTWLIGGCVATAVLAIGSIGYCVYDAGFNAARVQQLNKSVKVLRERKTTNETVHGLSDADLCRQLGGVPNDGGQCL